MTRKLSVNLFSSLDGAVENPHLWQGEAFDGMLSDFMGSTLGEVDDVLLGRHTYESWSRLWTREDVQDPFQDFINPVRKHVASRTLKPAGITWQNTRLVTGRLKDYVRELKETEGRTISVQGSLSVVAQLVLAGLVDELHMIIHPVLVGPSEERLMDVLGKKSDPVPLQLLDSQTNSKGVAVLTYGPRRQG